MVAQRSMYLAGKQDYDSADDKFFSTYYGNGRDDIRFAALGTKSMGVY